MGRHLTSPGHKITNQLFPSCGPFLLVWITNHMSRKMWDAITYPFQNFTVQPLKFWERISNLTRHFVVNVITYIIVD